MVEIRAPRYAVAIRTPMPPQEIARTRYWEHSVAAALTAIALLAPSGLVSAQDYPSRPITLIVPFPPGGSTSIVGRIGAEKMSAGLGQQIGVYNRGGARGARRHP